MTLAQLWGSAAVTSSCAIGSTVHVRGVGALVEAHDEIVELDCNPVVVTPDGAIVLDARTRVEPVQPKPLFGARG